MQCYVLKYFFLHDDLLIIMAYAVSFEFSFIPDYRHRFHLSNLTGSFLKLWVETALISP